MVHIRSSWRLTGLGSMPRLDELEKTVCGRLSPSTPPYEGLRERRDQILDPHSNPVNVRTASKVNKPELSGDGLSPHRAASRAPGGAQPFLRHEKTQERQRGTRANVIVLCFLCL